ncbi:MAG: PKD domain-containing protein [Treponema sp.]|nr:PKD domain-containing protein [Treponema sp.]
MKIKDLFLFAGAFLAFILSSCSLNFSGGDEKKAEGKYGSLTIKNSSLSRALDVSAISYADIKVFVGDEKISCNNVEIKGGSGSFEIENIPTGKNRIVQVQAFDSQGEELFGGVIRTVTDITCGNNSCFVNRYSTSLGNVFYYLLQLDFPVNTISEEEKTAISQAIDSAFTFEKINSQQIARDFMDEGISGLKEKEQYVLGESLSDKIILHAKGYQYLWYWETGEGGLLLKMDEDEEKGSGWYTASLDYSSINLLFKTKADWSGSQTDDLSRSAGNWYYENGSWTGSSSADTKAPLVSWLKCAGVDENGNAAGTVSGDVSGDVELFAFSRDEGGISKLEYYAGSTLIGQNDGTVSFVWDSTLFENDTYSIKAVAYDNSGNCGETESISVRLVNVVALKAVISSGSAAMAGREKTFDGSASKGDVLSWNWTFGDGSQAEGSSVKHTYSEAGKYTVTLTVTGRDGERNSVSQTVNVSEYSDFVHRDFRDESVYFMMTDRFADGDKTNNNIWGDEYLPCGESQLYDYSEDKCGVLSYYHGGDFKGIIDNLDYIADMGFTAIWITPSVKQPEGRYYYDGSNGGDAYQASAFHGYWGYDFDKIDPHLHSGGKNSDGWAEYKEFIDACHAKGIRVMQDIVINHGNHTAATAPTKWADFSVQTIMDGKSWAWQTLDPYYEAVPEGSTPSKNGFYSYYGFGQCADLIDFGHLGQDGKDSRHHIINAYKKFIDAGVDAFRIDTMAYIPNEFAGEFADAMYNYAKEKGNDYFYMIGEAWCGRYDAVARHASDKTDSLHMLDMHLSCLDYPGQMQPVFKDGSAIGAIYNNVIAQGDRQFDCMTAEEYTKTAMFVDNHDCYRCEGMFSEAGYKNALNYIYLFRGVPIVYYGTEAMYSWSGTHPSTNKDDVVSRWMLGERGINYVKQNKPSTYKHLKVLNQLYHSSECIRKGEQENVSINTIPAAFTRTYKGKTAAVLLNHQSSAGSYSFTGLPAGKYTLYTSDGSGVLNSQELSISGTYSLSAPANGFAVLDPK